MEFGKIIYSSLNSLVFIASPDVINSSCTFSPGLIPIYVILAFEFVL